MKPISSPNIQRPVLVWQALTGSVAMKTMPKAKPPSTRCQYQGIANIGLVSLPMALNSSVVATMPTNTPAMMRHDAMPRVDQDQATPSRQASVEVSPIEPCDLADEGLGPGDASVDDGRPCHSPRRSASAVAPL